MDKSDGRFYGGKNNKKNIKKKNQEKEAYKLNQENKNYDEMEKEICNGVHCTEQEIQKLVNLKNNLAKIKYDFNSQAYYFQEVDPLLKVFEQLTLSANNLSFTALNIAQTNLDRKSNVKYTLELTHRLIRECDDVYECTKKKINILKKINGCK